MLSILAVSYIALHGSAAEPGSAATKPRIIYVHAGAIKRSFFCGPDVAAGHIQDGIVYANLRRGDDRYLLIGYTEASRPNHPDGRCGGGSESYLRWLHIRGSTVVASQLVHYESCWEDIEGGPPQRTGQFCVVRYKKHHYSSDSSENFFQRSEADFDTKAPEKGLQIGELPPETVK